MPDLIPFKDIAHLFDEFQHTAWRFESQRGYASDRDSPNWPLFERGERITYTPENPWHAKVRTQTEAGKRYERVRLIDDPPTVGQRFLLASGLANVDAGEDIRNLYRSEAEQLALPTVDFWLFDSRILIDFVIDDAGNTLGVQVTEDPSKIVRACQARDAAWHHAVPTVDFQAQVASVV